MKVLPIQEITPQLLKQIALGDCILSAPPGAGKSTYLPLQLLDLPFFDGRQILLLQPRQVAVRSIASFLASCLGQKVGQTVGYQMRGESSVSSQTRLLVITEGLLVAKLQADPELNNIALIIFDEFHERSVQSDIALGLSLETQAGLREDLRLLVMSATLNVNDLKKLMPHAKVMSSKGRGFPIEYYYRPVVQHPHKRAWAVDDTTVSVVREAYQNHSGNMLVFLSGAASINRLVSKLSALMPANALVVPLYGALSAEQQKKAIDTPPEGLRKIVLATNIAETSLTINGVNIVIDSGREKVQRFNIARKINQLSEQMISKASSIQRAGRAGRQQAGVCFRLWSQEQQQFLQEDAPAQITQVDLSQTLLTLLEWGTDFKQLPLIDKPSAAQIDYAFSLLRQLDLISADLQITTMGKQATRFNTHPRLARMLVYAQEVFRNSENMQLLTVVLVAIIEGKPLDKLVGSRDIVIQCQFVIRHLASPKKPQGSYDYYQNINRISRQLSINLTKASKSITQTKDLLDAIANILLTAFSDKVANKRQNTSYLLADGTGADYTHHDGVMNQSWIICTNIQLTNKTNADIRQYCELPAALLSKLLVEKGEQKDEQNWDEQLGRVVGRKVFYLSAIEISSQASKFKSDGRTSAILFQQIRRKGLDLLLGKANTYIERVLLAKQIDHEYIDSLPNLSILALTESMELWLLPYLDGITSWQQLGQLTWVEILSSMLSYQQQQYINEYFPTHFRAPTGNTHKLNYSESGKVTLAIRVQELYGLALTPSVGMTKLPITLSLLSPAHREIQKTSDLSRFWTGSYLTVQKEMKGRYPKHYWPDQPANASPTTKTKKKMGL